MHRVGPLDDTFNHLSMGLGHVRRFLGKCINVSQEKGDKHEFLFSPYVATNARCLRGLPTNLHNVGGNRVRLPWAQTTSKIIKAILGKVQVLLGPPKDANYVVVVTLGPQ